MKKGFFSEAFFIYFIEIFICSSLKEVQIINTIMCISYSSSFKNALKSDVLKSPIPECVRARFPAPSII